ncbi:MULTISPECIES: peptide ABC transporter substrate-binding protein [unclassified Fusibacter]|uniref:peptide ABC transporter substrate-binding protein n=1 Tax=unclassified Fusibacter TaxID=2624464 RepID=UPI001010CD93|nr:peptide ABC transporter substrate-binding protein [Fusibacter sp. A1]MCK8060787.1 peptide ABC transporter substrate-binding protein [Fusibacter sp. A2]NPE23083.1 peptide ABC transporter substrate-binding protein [Fusibacter sp. A1]RXV59753.1 peptide ABC transporter substrate-binding protein [Fusibacter sp. A1]
MKKIIMVLTILSAVMLLMACSPESKTESNGESEEVPISSAVNRESKTEVISSIQNIDWNLGAQPTSLDPQLTTDPYGQQVISQLYEGLFRYDGDELVLGLCESYTLSADGLVYTFVLKDTEWDDGSTLTAYDFEYAWRRAINPLNNSGNAQYFKVIEGVDEYMTTGTGLQKVGIKAIGSSILEVRLEAELEGFMHRLTLPCFMPVKNYSVEEGVAPWYTDLTRLATNGPFKLVEVNYGLSYVLHDNTRYHMADQVKLNSIVVGMVVDDNAMYLKFRGNSFTVIDVVLPEIIDELEDKNADYHIKNNNSLIFVAMNQKNRHLSDAGVREALSLAIDRTALSIIAQPLSESPATGMVPTGVTDSVGNLFRNVAGDYDINVEEAQLTRIKALFENGGHDGENLPPLKLVYPVGALHSEVVDYLAMMWKENLDVDVRITQMSWVDYQNALAIGDYDLALVDWRFPLDDPLMILSRLMADGEYNVGNWKSVRYDHLISTANTLADFKRDALIYESERILMDQVAIIPLYYGRDNYLVKETLKGWSKTPSGYWNFSRAYMIQ